MPRAIERLAAELDDTRGCKLAGTVQLIHDGRIQLIVNTPYGAGTGGQARTHLQALPHVRDFRRTLVWGRETRIDGQDWRFRNEYRLTRKP